ncbi:MAG: NADPH:quinone oxidoreductase family protein [Aeromicrobium sp.]|uniref:NADPH:quinone oxidoreductase family protein n=1 Tax=Aeromicrobium sp. TaxID=1871063 RepID=UPI002612C9B6|nr:NADPH:quinone oxidoreductase family protein [Aeromicrobium sp.]MDF1704919.1 NADPH:quinone oxidoreductase family protein [Aeromicrobium sp.]
MKAVLVEEFGPPEGLVVREVEAPSPGPGEVLVDVAAASLNFPDVLVVAGTYQILPERPFIPGKELAGTVVAVGSDVRDLAVGDRVAAQLEHGAYASQVVVPQDLAVRVPEGVDLAVAATAGLPYVTAHYALRRRAQLRTGETVLVTGATGGVGAAAVQLAKAWGATVIATSSDESGAAVLREQGADHVIAADPGTLRDEVRRLTDGRGVDVAVEAIGGDLFAQVLRSMAWEGRLVVVGFASGDVPQMKTGHVLVKNIAVTGLQVSDYRDRDPQAFSAVIGEILELIAAGRVNVDVASRFPLDETPKALGLIASRAVRGRIVVEP